VQRLSSMRRYFPLVIIVCVGLATVGGGVMFYRAKRTATLTIPHDRSSSGKADAESLHILGPVKAPVTLEEFGDYQCPPCGRLAEPLNKLEKEFSPHLRFIFRNFPLSEHAHAREAAIAAEAAGLQGKFWEMHDLLYREQDVWSHSTDVQNLFESYAGLLGLDVQRFKKDMSGGQAEGRVIADQSEGTSLGIKNTPTLFLNNRQVEPTSMAPDLLRAAVESAIKASHPSS
jgi:protein-disulfide isomerase